MFNKTSLRVWALQAVLAVIGISALLAAAPANAQIRYQGRAALTVELVDIFGQPVGQQTYITNVDVQLGPPDPRGTNPFELVVQSIPLVNAPGEVSLWSSLPAEGVLFQYWTYQYDPASGTFAGALTNNHVAEAIALNLLTIPVEIAPNLPLPSTLAMANGTQMNGYVDVNQIQIQVLGNTTDQAHPFVFVVIATRVG
jgi:hypothetical protein